MRSAVRNGDGRFPEGRRMRAHSDLLGNQAAMGEFNERADQSVGLPIFGVP